MRLLNSATKQLEEFFSAQIPEYAILSHTWGDEEVLFRHIAGSDDEKRLGENMKGYSKITAACKQAQMDNFTYIWIDTCCIDKESSAELSEAINSMYTWYRNSQVCYAYLVDVPSNENPKLSNSHFRRSRWFRRGWTLQELIAPQSLIFYGLDWAEIGTKNSLQDTVSEVTRIRAEMIMEYDAEAASVAEKMSWAAERVTGRIEDIAYCLMGLFDINMPLLYGEGEKAFIRLQEEIMKVSNDNTIFAWKSTKPHSLAHQEYRGLLTHSPADFRESGNIVKIDHAGGFLPYSITNIGLQIQLPIRLMHRTQPDVFLASLGCTDRNNARGRNVAIYLKGSELGGPNYLRISPHRLELIDISDFKPSTLYVKQHSPQKPLERPETQELKIKIWPNDSAAGFAMITPDVLSISEGKASEIDIGNEVTLEKIIIVLGIYHGYPWLDVTTITAHSQDEFLSYSSKPQYDTQKQRRDRLTARLSGDGVVFVSIRKLGGRQFQLDVHIYKESDSERPCGSWV